MKTLDFDTSIQIINYACMKLLIFTFSSLIGLIYARNYVRSSLNINLSLIRETLKEHVTVVGHDFRKCCADMKG